MSRFDQPGWVETDSADNGIATATKAAVAGSQYVIYSVTASFTSTTAKLLQVKDGSTVIYEEVIYDGGNIPFPKGIAITPGNAVSAVLAASGAGANIGYVNIHGNTV